jgi:ATP adenylyltransferase
MEYIASPKSGKDICIFCTALEESNDLKNLIVYRGKLAFAILNRYPYTNGHLMIVPYDHQPSFDILAAEIRSDLMEMMTQAVQVLTKIYKPAGFNVGANIGAAAGAGVTGHVHFHVLPRWVGDTNFMTTLASARVLPETMEDTYAKVQHAWKES